MGMKPLTLETIARVTGGKYVGDGVLEKTRITGVVKDSRSLRGLPVRVHQRRARRR